MWKSVIEYNINREDTSLNSWISGIKWNDWLKKVLFDDLQKFTNKWLYWAEQYQEYWSYQKWLIEWFWYNIDKKEIDIFLQGRENIYRELWFDSWNIEELKYSLLESQEFNIIEWTLEMVSIKVGNVLDENWWDLVSSVMWFHQKLVWYTTDWIIKVDELYNSYDTQWSISEFKLKITSSLDIPKQSFYYDDTNIENNNEIELVNSSKLDTVNDNNWKPEIDDDLAIALLDLWLSWMDDSNIVTHEWVDYVVKDNEIPIIINNEVPVVKKEVIVLKNNELLDDNREVIWVDSSKQINSNVEVNSDYTIEVIAFTFTLLAIAKYLHEKRKYKKMDEIQNNIEDELDDSSEVLDK